MRGGDTVEVAEVRHVTWKARRMFDEACVDGGEITAHVPQPGDHVRLFSDDSPFFIHESGPYRIVLCVAHGYELKDRVFTVVDAQRRHRK